MLIAHRPIGARAAPKANKLRQRDQRRGSHDSKRISGPSEAISGASGRYCTSCQQPGERNKPPVDESHRRGVPRARPAIVHELVTMRGRATAEQFIVLMLTSVARSAIAALGQNRGSGAKTSMPVASDAACAGGASLPAPVNIARQGPTGQIFSDFSHPKIFSPI